MCAGIGANNGLTLIASMNHTEPSKRHMRHPNRVQTILPADSFAKYSMLWPGSGGNP